MRVQRLLAGDRVRFRLWICGLLLSTALPIGASGHLTLAVSPEQSFAPANLIVRVRIEPDADNRSLEIIADSEEFYRSSLIQLDGERAPRIIVLRFRGVPGGRYIVSGVLTDGAGRERASARRQVIVIPSGDR